jgi:membrane-associated phospholipid phosphatase
MRKVTPIHGLTFFLLIGLIGLTLLFKGHIPLWHSLLLRCLMLMALLFVLKISSDRRGKGRAFLNDFSPLIFIVLIYESLGDLIQYLRQDIDTWLIQIDLFLFGVHPTVWIERWIVPWFTDIMSLAYFSYYFLPLTLIIVLYIRKQKLEFNESIFVLTFGYCASFIGYILFPAIGPRYTLTSFQSVPLEGTWITDFVRDSLNYLEHNKRDCMPSGHTQIVLMVLFLAHRYERTLFYIFLPIICGLILSTVYLRYHYVVDIFAGVALAIGCVIVGDRLYRWWNPESRRNDGVGG